MNYSGENKVLTSLIIAETTLDPREGGGGSPLYGLYGDAPLDRVRLRVWEQ